MPVETHNDIVPATGIEPTDAVETHEDIKPAMGVTAYHGSPHEFDDFDISKIGTGEGAQAYGHGLYFAENEDVARDYRDRLTDRASTFNVDNIDMPKWILRRIEAHPDRAQAISEIRKDFQNRLTEAEEEARGSHQPWMASGRISTAKDVLAGLDKIEGGSSIPHTHGRMYEVRLDAGPEHLLDWDKPLSEQPAYHKVRNHWDDKVGDPDIIAQRLGLNNESTGRDLYEAMSGHQRNQQAASKALSEIGVRGIRYLDAGSRGKDGKTGSSNYVIFDPKHIKTVRRYASGGGIKAYFMHAPHEAPKRAQRAYGGAINPIELRDDPEDMARRLILWSYAVAPVVRPLSRAEGGPVDDPVDKALSVAGASQPNAAQKAVETARSLTPMGFYSAAAEAASKIPQRAPIDQIINKVKGSPGVKAEELDQSGVRDAFAGQRSVDPKEVARHFQENLPKIEEKTYGGAPIVHKAEPVDPEYFFGDDVPRGVTDTYVVGPRFKPAQHYQIHEYGPQRQNDDSEYYLRGPKGDDLGSYESLDSAVEAANAAIAGREPPRWKEYNGQMLVLPGGENYREVVMHMPKRAGSNEPPFKSTHWKEDNVLAHLRMHDRTDGLSPEQAQDIYQRIADANKIGNVRHLGSGAPSVAVQKGVISPEEAAAFARHKGWTGSEYFDKPGIDNKNKILHIEEIQSDWAQKGRDEGFYDPAKKAEIEEKAQNLRDEREMLLKEKDDILHGRKHYETMDEGRNRLVHINNRLGFIGQQFLDEINPVRDSLSIPPGPYVTDTNSWTDLALKRALKEAAEGGYDKMIWTPGEQQAGRYNLSHQVREVAYNPQTKRLIAMTHGGEDFGPQEPVEPKDIGKHIGKAAAKKLLEQTPNNLGMHSLRGDDLKVGGHGMVEYYDRIVPSRLQALVKKLDPESKIELFSHEVPDDDRRGTVKAHALHLTPKLREAILKGLPAYERGGPVLDHAFKVVSRYS